MISALSHEFRKLDGVSVTDTQPALKIGCVVMVATTDSASHVTVGYASSVAITDIDGRLINNWLFIETTIDTLAHRIAVAVDGNVIEQMRRDAQPSSSP